MAKAETRTKAQGKTEAEGVSHPPLAPPVNSLDRLADLTRRIIAVPKAELPTKQKPKKRKRRDRPS